MGGKRIGGLKTRVGCECCISRRESRWARLSSGGILAGGVRGRSYSADRCRISKKKQDAAVRGATGVRAAKNSESRKGE